MRKVQIKIGLPWLLLLLFQFSNSSSYAQVMTRLSGQQFELDTKIHSFKNSDEIFKAVPDSYEEFIKSKEANHTANTLGLISLLAVGGGLALGMIQDESGKHCDSFCLNSAQEIGVIAVIFVFPISGLFALLSRASATRKQKNAIRLFNDFYADSIPNLDEDHEMNLSLGFTSNGLSFVIFF